MNPKSSTGLATGAGCGGCLTGIIVILIINVVIGGLCAQYTFQEWMSSNKGERVEIEFWKCAIVGSILGELTIPAAAVTWLIDPAEDVPASESVTGEQDG